MEFNPQPKPVRKKQNKVGEWARVRSMLKEDFEKAGITSCEIRFNGVCTPNNFLGFAHYTKRRFLKEGELTKAILACQYCHYILECRPRPEMEKAILKVIAERKVKV